LSVHRTRPPCPGIHRRTRCIVVDNSALGKEANTSGKLAYCIHVYKQGGRKKHMPHATLGDKVRILQLFIDLIISRILSQISPRLPLGFNEGCA
uniref:60S ribosomal protein L23 n=1 Tax=Anisakis simplex TaxID=6269 RepID=A0A0M3JBS2_ANISI